MMTVVDVQIFNPTAESPPFFLRSNDFNKAISIMSCDGECQESYPLKWLTLLEVTHYKVTHYCISTALEVMSM